MLNISTNVGRAPVDGADTQSRWSSNGEGSRSDGGTSGFDDVFSQVNRSTASASGAGASATAPQNVPNETQSSQDSGAPPHGLADLLARARTGSNGSAVLTPADSVPTVTALPSADAATATASESRATDAFASAALDTAPVDLPTLFLSNVQTVATATMPASALATLADFIGMEAADAKGQTAGTDPTSGGVTASRRPKAVDATNAATAPTMDATDAILAALLVAQAPAPAPVGATAAAPQANGKKAEAVTAASTDDAAAVSDLPDSLVEVVKPTDGTAREPMPSALLDAQVALRPAVGDRTLVSVVAQATHFPVVERLSLSQQLAAPIAEAATSMADTPTTAAATAPLRTLDVTLSPGDLGTVTISMRLVGGSLHLGVEAQDAGTARLIERDKATLANALHASGYSVADLTIVHSVEAGGQTQSGDNNAPQDQRSAPSGDTSGSETSGNGPGSKDQPFSQERSSSQQGRPGGEVGGGAPVGAQHGVYL